MRRFVVVFFVLMPLISMGIATPLLTVAQEATPAAEPFPMVADPADCTGEPADVNALLDVWYGAGASPVAMTDGSDGTASTEITVPVGSPATDAVTAEVISVVHGVFSCFAAGDAARAFGYFSDDLAREFGPEPGTPREDAEAFMTGTPQPEAEDERSTIVAITDVMMLSEGRVGAFVVEGFAGQTLTSYAIFVQQDDRWVVDEIIEFSQFDDQEPSTPTP